MERSMPDQIDQIRQEIATLQQQISEQAHETSSNQNTESVYPDPEFVYFWPAAVDGFDIHQAQQQQEQQPLQLAEGTQRQQMQASANVAPALSPQVDSSLVSTHAASAAAAAPAANFPNGRRRYWKCSRCNIVRDRKSRVQDHIAREHPNKVVEIVEAPSRPR